MRHTESLARQNVDMAQAIMGPLISENQSLRRQRDDWEGKRLEAHLTLEELLTMKHVRDLELSQFQQGEDRKNQFWEAFISKWGPEMIKRFGISKEAVGAITSGSIPVNGSSIAAHQKSLRDVFKVLDKEPIYESLDDDQRSRLDGLLGLGDDPESELAFKEQLAEIWKALPQRLVDTIGESLLDKHPEKARAFVELLGVKV